MRREAEERLEEIGLHNLRSVGQDDASLLRAAATRGLATVEL
ncbi:MAG: hypothetical protein M0Z40_18905 [Actinomycetota bacterium]|jgi:hypothetical protein|nr:hypothetical protein [Actinomycetota bacterium]